MSNTITIELSAEDRARLDKILEALQGQTITAAPAAPVEEHPVEEPFGSPEPAAEPTQPEYTKADIVALAQELAAPNSAKREQARAIVKSYAAKVSDIPAEKYAEVIEKLTALKEA